MSGVENQSEIWRLESGCTLDSVVWIHSGICSSDSLRSLKSRRSLEVVFTLDPGVWIPSGVCSLDSLRSLQSGFTPESGGWSLSGVCSHTGVCSLELLGRLESRATPEAVVWSLESFRVCSLESLQSLKSRRSLECAFIPEPRTWSHTGVWSRETIRNIECGILMYSGFCNLDRLRSL